MLDGFMRSLYGEGSGPVFHAQNKTIWLAKRHCSVDVVHGGDLFSSGKSNSLPLVADGVEICLR